MAITHAAPIDAGTDRTRPVRTGLDRTRGERDRGIDLVRACCIVGVVVLHAMMVGVTVTSVGPVFENASDGTAWIAPLSWVLQVMPLFFVIGGFAGLLAYRRHRSHGAPASAFVAARLHRLLLPAVVSIGCVGAALAMLTVVGVPADLVAMAGFRFGQPLWFLGVFLLCQALLPALAAAHERAPLRSNATLAIAAVLVDVLRAATGVDALGFINLVLVWTALQQLGFFLADGSIGALSRRVRAAAGVGAVVVLVLTWWTGVYSSDLIANINPPTAALLLVGVAHTALLSLVRERLTRLSARRRVAFVTDFVTRRAMTIYLWHMPVLLAMAGASAVFALTTGIALPAPDSLGWWLGRPLWLAVALTLTALVATVFARVEAVPSPVATGARRRLAIAVLLGLGAIVALLVIGTTVLSAALVVVLILAALLLSAEACADRRSQRCAPTVVDLWRVGGRGDDRHGRLRPRRRGRDEQRPDVGRVEVGPDRSRSLLRLDVPEVAEVVVLEAAVEVPGALAFEPLPHDEAGERRIGEVVVVQPGRVLGELGRRERHPIAVGDDMRVEDGIEQLVLGAVVGVDHRLAHA
ncbi:Peptidoglycan/LPS O-acetylase OafA/YrhL, contains acyltransferase and SGNH-hydrolase domains [Plantibacter sp. VKM Ac-1784]|uniref:Peptidoglycan/LPS O-acetylase OafA/YrhL, contains acyltransferase and SGNH-hydrolase domains n=1 Tax=Plantibacter elymi (nom. nud.) TaxID=199708 RepID=A0ABY1R8K1_9MICO|nr:Peptidoglycan/LPS O-acetylase OafA/YrhL, contains acyltransferase and SGNH-hydrolase domains [Plantibacter sp. VKM Ac-1784]